MELFFFNVLSICFATEFQTILLQIYFKFKIKFIISEQIYVVYRNTFVEILFLCSFFFSDDEVKVNW